jgi:pyruvate,water dikinase
MEEHNHYIDQLMNGQLRRAIMAAAHWLVSRHVLGTTDEVFWLYFDEILSALRADPSHSCAAVVTALIAARKARHAEWEQFDPPPLLGTPRAGLAQRPPLADEVTPTALQEDGRISGLGASPGCHRGRARIIATSSLLPELSAGEVLVAENMGPRWTPLIPTLGALVLDGGAVGQHHAITAREYGVPAVVGARNATRRIPEGAWVIVDGTTGVVEVQDL